MRYSGARQIWKKHRFPVALDVDVEHVGRFAILHGSLCDQRRTPLLLLDRARNGIVRGIGRCLIGKVHPRIEPDVDTARDHPDVEMWRHRPASATAGDRTPA